MTLRLWLSRALPRATVRCLICGRKHGIYSCQVMWSAGTWQCVEPCSDPNEPPPFDWSAEDETRWRARIAAEGIELVERPPTPEEAEAEEQEEAMRSALGPDYYSYLDDRDDW